MRGKPMKHLYIHIGWPKTGTSSLQAYWTRNPEHLARHGLAYYRSHLDSIGSICRQISRGEDIAPQAAELAALATRPDVERVLISSESLITTPMAPFLRFIRPDVWQRITVIAYLRPQAEYLESWYKQSVKWGGKHSTRSILTPASAPMRASRYATELSRWEDLCRDHGNGEVVVRLFDPAHLVGGDVLTDAMSVLGFPFRPGGDGAEERHNVSPSASLIRMYLKLPPIHKLQQINRRIVASGHPGATGSGDLFDADTVLSIQNRFADENELVRARYFPDRAQLFDRIRTREAAEIDKDGLRALLIDTIRQMRGDEVAKTAMAALQSG